MTLSTLDETCLGARRIAGFRHAWPCRAASVLPPSVVFSAIQAQERHPGYRHLLLPQARFARPRGMGALTPDEGTRLAPGGRPTLRVAPPGRSLADLAADAALDLRDQLGWATGAHDPRDRRELRAQRRDRRLGRRPHAVRAGLQRVTPFALGQNGTLGWYSALMLLDGLLDEGDQALVILSDKWLTRSSASSATGRLRRCGRRAARVARAGARAGRRRAVRRDGIRAVDRRSVGRRARHVARHARAGRRACDPPRARRTGLRAGEIDWCVPPGFDPGFAARVADAASIPVAARIQHEAAGHLSSAESAAALIRLAGALDEGERRTVLVWDAALHAAAAAVVDLAGGLDAALDIEGDA